MDVGGRVREARWPALLLVTGLLLFLMIGTALAATPQEIYDDFVADGDLDGNYTEAELQAVLSDPTLAQYGNQDDLDDLEDIINDRTEESEFPFTGAELALIGLGGIALVGGGLFLRRGAKKTS